MPELHEVIKFDRCNDCAFTPGTAANLSPLTPAKAEMCAMIGTPFWCHLGKKEKLCAGWTERVLTADGPPSDCPPWRQKLAEVTLAFIESVEDRDTAGTLPSDEELCAEHMALLKAAMEELPTNA